MATFAKDSQLKAYTLKDGKAREWIKDISTPYLYVYAVQGKKSLTKTFIFRYADEERKTNQIIIGKYPSITLAEARAKAAELKRLKERGEDIKKAVIAQKAVKFADVAREWIEKEQTKSASSLSRETGRINNYLMPYLKDGDVKTLARRDYAQVIERIQETETKKGISHDTSKRTFRLLRKILDLAVSKGYIDHNPTRDIIFTDTFKTSKCENFRAITDPERLGELLRAIDGFRGSNSTKQALIFGTHTFLRSVNVRELKWQYVSFDKDLIIFPAGAMKMRADFAVPLSRQTKELLKAQYEIRRGDFVFPSDITSLKPLSENTLNYALKRLGFGDETVFHGLRATASTLLNENIKRHGKDAEIIELCLDHRERNKIKSIYDRSQRLDERAELMQWWSDYLDEVKGE
nr:tyrosine-type recombinase/integrase [uncultured Campylobacter sp.]